MTTTMYKAVRRSVALMVVSMMLCPSTYAIEIGQVTYVEGRVDLFRQNVSEAVPLREGDIISIGDSVRTKSNSKAEVSFKDRSVVRMAQSSKITIEDYVLGPGNTRKTATILLERGKARTMIAKMSDQAEFNINTPNAAGTVKGSDVVALFQAGSSNMLVSEGRLSISNALHPLDRIVIPAGNSVLIPLEEAPKGPRPYLDLEKRLHMQDTDIPAASLKRSDAIVSKGTFVKFSGMVTVISGNKPEEHKASVNEMIQEGDTVITGKDGVAEIKFDNGNGINLKPDTRITVTRLLFDPKTREYENLFEAASGKVRARIENLKGKSKFEIKTPQAICGARGTIMYLDIAPGSTRAYFEGGSGYLRSTITGLEQAVPMGTNAYADRSGAVSQAAQTSNQDRMDTGSGWDPGDGTEGYSSPDGNVGVYVSSNETSMEIIDSAQLKKDSGGNFSDLPFDHSGDGIGTGDVVVEPVELPATGSFYALITHQGDQEADLRGYGTTDPLFGQGAATSYLATGAIESLNQDNSFFEPFIWRTAMSDSALGNTDHIISGDAGTGYTYGGTAYYGKASGIGGGGIMEGSAAFFYIDKNGNVGVSSSGALAGIYSLQAAQFVLGANDFNSRQISGGGSLGITAENFYASLYPAPVDSNARLETTYSYYREEEAIGGSFEHADYSGGYTSGSGNLDTMTLVNRETGDILGGGIYSIYMNGSFSKPQDADLWRANIGGQAAFGAIPNKFYLTDNSSTTDSYTLTDYDLRSDDGYFTATLNDTSWANNRIYGKLDGEFLTDTKMGTLSGYLYGTYSEDGELGNNFYITGTGTWLTSGNLTLSGLLGDEYNDEKNLYTFSCEGIAPSGSVFGLAGGVGSPWKEPSSFTSMGRWYSDTAGADMLMHTTFNSNDGYKGAVTTIDGGAFTGLAAEIWHDGTITGSVAAFYMDPGSRAGILLGNFTDGKYFTTDEEGNKGMWVAHGRLQAEDMGTLGNVTPADLGTHVQTGMMSAEARGLFGDSGYHPLTGSTESSDLSSSIYFINDLVKYTPWGIYELNFGSSNTYSNTGPAAIGKKGLEVFGQGEFAGNSGTSQGYWSGNMTGEGDSLLPGWDNGIIKARLNAVYMNRSYIGEMSGDVYGLYTGSIDGGEGAWMASSIGSYHGERLAWSTDSLNTYGYYSNGSSIVNDTGAPVDLIAGAADFSPVDEPGIPASIKVMGMAQRGADHGFWGRLAGLDQASYGSDQSKILIGSITGLIDPAAGTLSGGLTALYLDSKGYGGTLEGGFSAGFFYETEYFSGDGTITATRRSTGILAGYERYSCAISGSVRGDLGDTGSLTFTNCIRGSSIYDNGNMSRTSYLAGPDGEDAQDWGIYNVALSGTYANPGNSKTWSSVINGSSWAPSSYGDGWYARITGQDWSDGRIEGSMSGFRHISATDIDLIDGDFLGIYDNGNWGGEATGVYYDRPLAWSAVDRHTAENYYDLYLRAIQARMSLVTFIIGTVDDPMIDGSDTTLFVKAAGPSDHDYSFWGSIDRSLAKPSYGIPDGFISGVVNSKGGSIKGDIAAIYLDHNGKAGILIGDYDGNFIPAASEWYAMGELKAMERASGLGGYQRDSNLIQGTFSGNISNGGYIEAYDDIYDASCGTLESMTSFLKDQKGGDIQSWGIYNIELGGLYSNPEKSEGWAFNMSGTSWNNPSGQYWLASVKGDKWSDGAIAGTLRGVCFSHGFGDSVKGAMIDGKVSGNYVEAPGEGAAGTFQAVSVGEWVEVTELLDQKAMFGPSGLDAMNNFVNVPLTQVCSAALTGAGSFAGGLGSINSLVMDATLYAAKAGDVSGIWSALLSGTYSGQGADSWKATVSDPNDPANTVALTGTQWSGNQWVATVDGTKSAIGGNTLTGQVGGKYTDTGTFTGVGAGVWTAPAKS